MVVDHGFFRVHADLARPHLQAKLVVDDDFVTLGEKGEHVFVAPLVEIPELRQLEIVNPLGMEDGEGRRVDGPLGDFRQNVRLRHSVLLLRGDGVRDEGDVRGDLGLLSMLGRAEADVLSTKSEGQKMFKW